jgi:hypothetical protein
MAGNQIAMDHEKVGAVLEGEGAVEVKKEVLNAGGLHQYTGMLGDKHFMVKIFVNKNGKCTIGKGGGDAAAFEALSKAVAAKCRYGDAERFEVSLARFPADKVPALLAYLTGLGAKVEETKTGANYEQTRIRGPRGDALTVKYYTNGTLQFQGTHAQLAVWVQSFLSTVLSLDEILEEQRAVYKLPVTVAAIKTELAGRIPNVHDSLVDEVRMQLSSALGLTKVGVELEDYAALTFPALKGLEGYCLQLLRDECGLQPVRRAVLGEYFEQAGAVFAMRSPYKDTVALSLQSLVSTCYTTWNQQRHRLFHMDGTLETTTILDSRDDAVSIVDQVLTLIDRTHEQVLKTKK